MVKFAFVDESGDLGKFGSKYFIIASLITSDTKRISKIIKRVRERKLKKKMKKCPEIKANNSNRQIREYVLESLLKCECDIYSLVINKLRVYPRLFDIQHRLYTYFCKLLLKEIDITDQKLIVTIDKKHTNTFLRKEFDNYIKYSILKKFPNIKIEIFHKPSYAVNELQVIDFVAWSIGRKFNTGEDYYFKLIEEKIRNIERMELWKKSGPTL